MLNNSPEPVVAPRKYSLMKQLTIIVPIYRQPELVKRCVDSLLDNISEITTHRPRILLINDSPDDATITVLISRIRQAHPNIVTFLVNERNVGFVRSVNRGLAHSLSVSSDALLVNSDTITFPGTLAELLTAASSDSHIAFVSPRSNSASLCSLPHQSTSDGPNGITASFNAWKLLSKSMPKVTLAPTAVGFYLFIANHILANVGFFRSDFDFGYEEENDLIMRAGKLGYRAALANHAFAYHEPASPSFCDRFPDIQSRRCSNLRKMNSLHPEFVPLVQRYESSSVFRAERLLGGLAPFKDGKFDIIFDLRFLGQHYDGTSKVAAAVVAEMARRHSDQFRVFALAKPGSLAFHGLRGIEHLHHIQEPREKPYSIAVALRPPYDLHDINLLQSLAPINLYMLHDTISEDCTELALAQNVFPLWEHVSRNANGLIFNSKSSQADFCFRHPRARHLPHFSALLPTRLCLYRPDTPRPASPEHVLIVGNAFAHKGVDQACHLLASVFPEMRFVVVGGRELGFANTTVLASGKLEQQEIEKVFATAQAVVLPSHAEGFGFALLNALAAGKPVVARDLPATREILETFSGHTNVQLFSDDRNIAAALNEALTTASASADDSQTYTWEKWTSDFSCFCTAFLGRNDIYAILEERIRAGDLLRASMRTTKATRPLALAQLLELDGEEFLGSAYITLLGRSLDSGGRASYLREMEKGVAKIELLYALANSPEGKANKLKVRGLRSARWKHKAVGALHRLPAGLRRLTQSTSTTNSERGLTETNRAQSSSQLPPCSELATATSDPPQREHPCGPAVKKTQPAVKTRNADPIAVSLSDSQQRGKPEASDLRAAVDRIYAAMRLSNMNALVGGSDPQAVGDASVAVLKRHLKLVPNSRILDFGCGIGRVALSLLTQAPERIELTGFDIVPHFVKFCRNRITPLFPNARFELLDGNNSHYNNVITLCDTDFAMTLSQVEAAYFSYFDNAYAFSVFTHLEKRDFVATLKFLSNVTKSDARILITCFLLTSATRKAIQSESCRFSFEKPHYEDDGAIFIGNNSDRLAFIAYDETLVQKWLAEANLHFIGVERGSWSGLDGSGLQDVIVCRSQKNC